MSLRSGDLAGVAVLRETLDRLDILERLVERWNPTINLVSAASLPDLWTRHIADSAQLWPLRPGHARTWVDLGSGAGFPGLVVAALAAETADGVRVTLVESDGRKVAFLRQAAREMGLALTILDMRAEAAPPQASDVVSARALAPLGTLLPFVLRHLAPDGTALLHKGRGHEAEVAAARTDWRFDLDAQPSLTDPDARVLRLTNLAHG